MDSSGFIRNASSRPGIQAFGAVRSPIAGWKLTGLCFAAAFVLALVASRQISNEYVFYAGIQVLQLAILATGWNILGGFCGYVNFGSSAFLALGAYSAAFVAQLFGAPLLVQIVLAGLMGCLLGAGVGYISLRLSGIYFAISTVAVAVVLQTIFFHWDYMGGARGVSSIPVAPPAGFASYNRFLFVVFAVMLLIALSIARYLQTSWFGIGLRALRNDEVAAEANGVPTLRMKVLAATCSGGVMALAGAPQLAFANVLEPMSAFSQSNSIAALAMSIVGGTSHWLGPLLGSLLLGLLQQITTVTLTSELNMLIQGLVLMICVIVMPRGIVGTLQRRRSLP
jgi:branched-chain amino acid transport system permease protein